MSSCQLQVHLKKHSIRNDMTRHESLHSVIPAHITHHTSA